VLATALYGKGFLTGGWDPNRGRRVQREVCECGAGEPGAACCGVTRIEEALTGDFFVRAVSPHLVLVEENAFMRRLMRGRPSKMFA